MSITKKLLLVLVGGFSLFSCIKHVVIPPPLPIVQLDASFRADTNGIMIVYSKGVNGFDMKATNFREINTPPQLSSIKYFCTMESVNVVEYFKVSLGRDTWNSSSGNFPPVNQFKVYFESLATLNIPFSDNADTGVIMEWRDANNKIWKTSQDSPLPQFFKLLSVSQESDEFGDYLKFTAEFAATFYSPDGLESKYLNNGLFVGYFQNN